KFNVIYTAKPAMLYLILGGLLGGTVGVVGFYAALKFISVSKAVPIISTFPLLAALFAVISLGEKLTPQLLVGTALVVAGIALVGYS
ncbi:MAG: EamA family transporter, partial [Euryarchaeota archaeon]|nr:EamA family transporter [Euryarchaeota archaeon]